MLGRGGTLAIHKEEVVPGPGSMVSESPYPSDIQTYERWRQHTHQLHDESNINDGGGGAYFPGGFSLPWLGS